MSNEMQKADHLPETLLDFVAQAVKDPAIDVAKLDTLLRMQREILADNARVEFTVAMNRAQAEIQPVARATENTHTHSWYAKLEAVDAAIRPIYLEHGFALTYDAVEPLTPGQIRMQCRCTHIAGHSEIYHREAPADTLGPQGKAVKTALHGAASTETFLKRYLTCGIFNIVFKDQDDDGVRGGQQFIDAAAIYQLRDLMKETGSDLAAFCRVMEVNSLAEIQTKDYPKAVNALMAKRRPSAIAAKAPAEAPGRDELLPGAYAAADAGSRALEAWWKDLTPAERVTLGERTRDELKQRAVLADDDQRQIPERPALARSPVGRNDG